MYCTYRGIILICLNNNFYSHHHHHQNNYYHYHHHYNYYNYHHHYKCFHFHHHYVNFIFKIVKVLRLSLLCLPLFFLVFIYWFYFASRAQKLSYSLIKPRVHGILNGRDRLCNIFELKMQYCIEENFRNTFDTNETFLQIKFK